MVREMRGNPHARFGGGRSKKGWPRYHQKGFLAGQKQVTVPRRPPTLLAVESKKAVKYAGLIYGLNGEETIKLTVKRAWCLPETLT
jgi:hypothetical protein